MLMKTKNIAVVLAWLVISPIAQSVVIQQVLYDAEEEAGQEFVQLVNEQNEPVDIGFWTISTKSFVRDATVPNGTWLQPRESYLIADAGWSASKPAEWPVADHEESLSIVNDDSGVALRDAQGAIIDALGWGNASRMDASFYRGVPADDVGEGFALHRIAFTDENAFDFVPGEPFIIDRAVDVDASVEVEEDRSPHIGQVTMNGLIINSPTSNSAARLSPGPEPALVEIDVAGERLDEVEVRFREQVVRGSSSEFILPAMLPPGTYPLRVIGRNPSGEDIRDFNVTVLPVIALSVEGAIDGVRIVPGNRSVVKGITVRNLGNVPVDIGAVVSGLRGLSASVDVVMGSRDRRLSSKVELLGSILQPNATLSVQLAIAVPKGAKKGKYDGKVSFTARAAR